MAMNRVDRLLGPLNPNKTAANTASVPKTVFVVNATEGQSASVCEALIKDNKWKVYGLVEDIDHPVAKKLASMQVHTIVGDITDPASYERHLKDMDGVFVHVEFDSMVDKCGDDVEKAVAEEVRLTSALVDACQKAGVKHLIYSTLDDLPDSHYVPHCWAKAHVAKYIKTTSLPTTYLLTSMPFNFILEQSRLLRNSDGAVMLGLRVPDDFLFPGYPTEQTGDWVKMALNKPKKWQGQDMHACTEHISTASMARDLSKVFKEPVMTRAISKDVFYSDEHRQKIGDRQWLHFKAIMENLVERDEHMSETIVPHQWSFRQWAAWSQDVNAAVKRDGNV